ncbi:MAG: hypothetical protein HC774_00980 [Sphingomonadales bacterium]|nr:hypothetical protein [Sphingomonadales bacterium]
MVAVNLLSIEGIHRILTGVVTNFTSFAPLGTVLVALGDVAGKASPAALLMALLLAILRTLGLEPRRIVRIFVTQGTAIGWTGTLLGVALNAMSNLLGRVVRLPHALRLTIVCLAVAGMLSGIIFLGGTTIAQQTTVLSNTLKSQLVNVKGFLERNGIDTSLFDFGSLSSHPDASEAPAPTTPPPTHSLPSAGTIASSGGAIFSQSLKLILGTASAVGNFFIVLFLGIAFATQPAVYRNGLLFMTPARHRQRATVIVDTLKARNEREAFGHVERDAVARAELDVEVVELRDDAHHRARGLRSLRQDVAEDLDLALVGDRLRGIVSRTKAPIPARRIEHITAKAAARQRFERLRRHR